MIKKVLSACIASQLLLLSACGVAGWPEYKAAMKCALKNDGTDCASSYREAIEINPNLPGVYSSFGSYLFGIGQVNEAVKYFELEAKQHPEIKQSISIIVKKEEVKDSTTNQTPEVIQ